MKKFNAQFMMMALLALSTTQMSLAGRQDITVRNFSRCTYKVQSQHKARGSMTIETDELDKKGHKYIRSGDSAVYSINTDKDYRYIFITKFTKSTASGWNEDFRCKGDSFKGKTSLTLMPEPFLKELK